MALVLPHDSDLLSNTTGYLKGTSSDSPKHLRVADAWAKTSQGAAPDLVHRMEQATEISAVAAGFIMGF